jgi:hypothetical protein
MFVQYRCNTLAREKIGKHGGTPSWPLHTGVSPCFPKLSTEDRADNPTWGWTCRGRLLPWPSGDLARDRHSSRHQTRWPTPHRLLARFPGRGDQYPPGQQPAQGRRPLPLSLHQPRILPDPRAGHHRLPHLFRDGQGRDLTLQSVQIGVGLRAPQQTLERRAWRICSKARSASFH